MKRNARIIHRVIERLNRRIAMLTALRDRLQDLADSYDEQDHEPDLAVTEV